MLTAPKKPSNRRSTSSKDVQGNAADRRRRKEWLVETFRANVDVEADPRQRVHMLPWDGVPLGTGLPACRCFHCGRLLTVDEVSPDRIKPGCEGGTYRRDNIRPACLEHNVKLGSAIGHARRKKA